MLFKKKINYNSKIFNFYNMKVRNIKKYKNMYIVNSQCNLYFQNILLKFIIKINYI